MSGYFTEFQKGVEEGAEKWDFLGEKTYLNQQFKPQRGKCVHCCGFCTGWVAYFFCFLFMFLMIAALLSGMIYIVATWILLK